MPDAALATKGSAVEEWIDLHFFRPVGIRIARALQPTAVSADQVTLWALVVGVLGAHCFLYVDPWIDALGFVLLVVSDVFDSADGQLARLRGTSTPFGRILDGLSDTVRFTALYVHVMVRLVVHHGWAVWPAVALGVAAGVSHSWQSAAVDVIRNAYLELGEGGGGELALPEDLAAADPRAARAPTLLARVARGAYRAYVRRQAWLCPATMRLVRHARAMTARDDGARTWFRATYRARQRGVIRQCAWLGQNIRWVLVGLPCALGRPAVFLWLTVLPLNAALVVLLVTHERRAAALLAAAEAPAAAAGRALGGEVHAG